MGEMVLGIGSSHAPMISMPVENWSEYTEADQLNQTLISTRTRTVTTFDELVSEADPGFSDHLKPEIYQQKYELIQQAINTLSSKLRESAPDVVVIVSDDQCEWLFDDVMPRFMVYWGETIKLIPRPVNNDTPPRKRAADWGYGDVELDVPVDVEFGEHLIRCLLDADFDVAHSRYMRESYGGSIGPADYFRAREIVKERRCGLPHGFAYVVKRLMDNELRPIVPIFQNTVYPPNQPSPRRSYALGVAIREAVDKWSVNKKVCLIASGGLSHQVLDSAADQVVLGAIANKDAETLCSIPRDCLLGASSETQNWITLAGACEPEPFHLVDYVPVIRSKAGTGGGWAFGYWEPNADGKVEK